MSDVDKNFFKQVFCQTHSNSNSRSGMHTATSPSRCSHGQLFLPYRSHHHGTGLTALCSLTSVYCQDGGKAPHYLSPSSTPHMWELLAMRKALDRLWVGVRVCQFLLLFVNSLQFQRTKTFQAVFEKVHLTGVQ